MGGSKPRRRPTTQRTAPPLRILHTLSDSTGNLARHTLSALLTQFHDGALDVRLHPFLNTAPKLEQALDAVEAEPGAVLHALVKRDAKARVHRRCDRLGLPCFDLTGDLARFIADATGLRPKPDLTRLHQVDAQYQRRISALDFTITHDDGLGLPTLHEADVVLTGVSRTSKTPTSILLAQEGLKVANVSLAMDVKPPQELLALSRGQVVGLTIDPGVLSEIRTRRWQTFGGATVDSRYADPDYVDREVAWCQRLFRQQGWRTLDVTDQAIEETAAKVLQIIRHRDAL
ncbi:MAG: pyruvate, water dikinase regulatory protein [Phycisphaeraceae bacterium]